MPVVGTPASSVLIYIPDIISSGADTIGSYFPQWMDIHYNTDPATGSLLRRFLVSPGRELLSSAYYSYKVEREKFLNNWLGEPSRGWYVGTDLSSNQITSVSITTPSRTIYPTICSTEWEFTTAVGPAYIVDNNNYAIYFMGLTISVLSVVATGTVTFPDGEILSGTDIYWREDATGIWHIEEPGSLNRSGPTTETTSTISNITGPVTIVYQSNSLLSDLTNATVSINNGPAVPLEYMDYWSSIDEIGLVVDLPRFLGEDNQSYWKRLKSVYPFLGSSTEDGLKQAVGRRLGVLDTSYWNGMILLTWNSSSIADVWIHELPKYSYSLEEMMKEQGLIYYTTKREIEQPYIFNEGALLNVTPASGRIYASSAYSNSLIANYRYTNYVVQPSGNITVLQRTGNTAEDIYEVAWTTGIQVNTLSKKKYKEQKLLTGDGLPTSLFLDIANNIRKKVNVTLGYARWEKVHWFTQDEISPQLDYIPIPMDT